MPKPVAGSHRVGGRFVSGQLVNKRLHILWVRSSAEDSWFPSFGVLSINHHAKCILEIFVKNVWKEELAGNNNMKIVLWGKYPKGKISKDYQNIFDESK
jgi:hypothetical protein